MAGEQVVDIGEEIQAAETTQNSQESISHDHQTTEGLTSADRELIDSLEKQNTKSGANQNDSSQRTKIRRVPDEQRNSFEEQEHFSPKAISIGPIHYDHFKDNQFSKRLKTNLAARYIVVSQQSGQMLLTKIKTNIKELRKSFDEVLIAKYDDDTLARILFLDGCSMLQFIYSFVENELNEFEINQGQAELVQRDLFLLENQIPFKVLILLVSLSENNVKTFMSTIDQFIGMNLLAPPAENYGRPSIFLEPWREVGLELDDHLRESVHFLDLFRSTLLKNNEYIFTLYDLPQIMFDAVVILLREIETSTSGERCAPMKAICGCFSKGARDLYACCAACTRNLCECCAGCMMICSTSRRRILMSGPSFHSAQELKATGIKLKPSNNSSLKAISFNTQFFGTTGILELPPLILDKLTVFKLWNLIAYEMRPDNYENDYAISSYLSFLDSLIDTEEDVKHLRSVSILWNRLSSDVDVANLFNKIGSKLVSNDNTYSKLKEEMQKHCKRRYASWIAQATRDYFSSPWTILALFAAVTALLLTAIQTWYAVQPKNGEK